MAHKHKNNHCPVGGSSLASMEDSNNCGFCHTGDDTVSICGTLHKDKVDGKVIAAHHKCMQYSALLVQYKSDAFGGFKIHEVSKELNRGKRLACYLCKIDKSKKNKKGATSGCAWASCRKTFHYYCVSLNPKTVAKRYRVQAGPKVVILYRVFCSKAHEEQYRKNLSAEDVSKADDDDDDDDDEDDDDDDDDDDDKSTNDDKTNDDDEDTDIDDDTRPDKGHDSDDEPVRKKSKASGSGSKEGKKEGKSSRRDNDHMSSPEMTPDEVVKETKRQYKTLLEKQKIKNGNGLNDYRDRSTNNGVDMATDSGGDVTEDYYTSNSPSPAPSVSENNQAWPRSHEGVVIVIPSKVDATDLKELCGQARIPVDKCVLWPSANNIKEFQDKHLPFVMWDIANKLRKHDAEGVAKIFTNISIDKYECLQSFQVQSRSPSENIHEKLLNITNKVNCQYKTEVCRIENVKQGHDSFSVLFLTLPQSITSHIDISSDLQVYRWTPDTTTCIIDDKKVSTSREKKILLKWLLPRIHDKDINLSKYPKDDTCRTKNDQKTQSVAKEMRSQLESHSQSLIPRRPVKVMVACNIDSTVVHYKPYIHKLVSSFLSDNSQHECYCILEVNSNDRFNDLQEVVPRSDNNWLRGHFNNKHEDKKSDVPVKVYSAYNPHHMPVTCLILHAPTDNTDDSSRIVGDVVQDSETDGPTLYLDVDEPSPLHD